MLYFLINDLLPFVIASLLFFGACRIDRWLVASEARESFRRQQHALDLDRLEQKRKRCAALPLHPAHHPTTLLTAGPLWTGLRGGANKYLN